MTEVFEHWPSLAMMGVLVLASAFFSASEAALFTLSTTSLSSLMNTVICDASLLGDSYCSRS
jgi:CBS domain containing-hemolysin-like protein